jgi:hypothetical protein
VTLRNLGRAILDGRSISGAQTLRIECGGGIPDDPKGCFYFEIQGTLFVNANTSAAAVRFDLNLSRTHNSAKIEGLIVNNAGPGWAVRLITS